ncbi:hypothetical protein TROPICALSUN_23 [Erwinia phage vB_EamM_TropicalSun]|uniref:Neck protein n=2 Tax=Myosmarvirus myosmar TaxID=2846183 RepID=A0A5B9NS72_9CAUD|nr:hypothetical protein TROPICALSUN_23 [Erwinia phage vB_EamM_TropicalSun]
MYLSPDVTVELHRALIYNSMLEGAMKEESEMLKKHIKALKEAKGSKVDAGWFESDRYPNGRSIAANARIQNDGGTWNGNWGIIVIPSRPFMRLAFKNFIEQRRSIEKSLVTKLLSGKITVDQMLNQIGMAMENSIVDSIKNGGWQPNAPSTIAKKGFDMPLIDDGHMWQNVNSKVTK